MFRRMLPKVMQEVIKQVGSVFVSKGSLGEVETQLLSAENIGRYQRAIITNRGEEKREGTTVEQVDEVFGLALNVGSWT